MDGIDRKITELLQVNAKLSSAEIAEAVGVSVSTANERVRRLGALGVISAWRAVLTPWKVDAGLCVFILVDIAYEGEVEAIRSLTERPEIQEIHHVSGPHSYLLKVRVADTDSLQSFMTNHVKSLKPVRRTETLVVFETPKETSALQIGPNPRSVRKPASP